MQHSDGLGAKGCYYKWAKWLDTRFVTYDFTASPIER